MRSSFRIFFKRSNEPTMIGKNKDTSLKLLGRTIRMMEVKKRKIKRSLVFPRSKR